MKVLGKVMAAAAVTAALGTGAYHGYRNERRETLALPAQLERYERAKAALPPDQHDLLRVPKNGIGDAWLGGAGIYVAGGAVGVAGFARSATLGYGMMITAFGAGLAYAIAGHVGRAAKD